jgi:hypothetical protein
MGGGSPFGSGPSFPISNFLADPEELRRRQFQEHQLQIQQLGQEIQRMKMEREDQFKKHQEEAAKKLRDGYVQSISATFDKAVAYTNLIIVAGYGAFVGLWSLTKGDVQPVLSTVAAILMIVSATTFVMFEVYKMYRTTNVIRDLTAFLEDPAIKNDATVLQNKMDEYQLESRRHNLTFVRVWRISVFICVPTGILAVLVLLGSFLYRLITLLT